ncbi:MAG TPA: type II toxin-antitoxin system VapC family toxin [Candidatus Acidoferrales bacterium]|nr:type II toxin-antitoxin system VapC family toxin [Candidatus Acidoferrales bacterium]
MRIFLDSSAIIEFLRNNGKVVEAIGRADEFYTSSLCAYEVLLGEKYMEEKGVKSRYKDTLAFFERMATVPFSHSDALFAAGLMAKLTLKGKKVDEIDVLIAAQAIAHQAQVLTMDSRHFKVIKDETGLSLQTL